MEFLEYIQAVIGSPPPGYECLEYLFAGMLLIILCISAMTFISGIFRYIGGM